MTANTATVDYSLTTFEFERRACGRCGGTGRYPSARWNGVCLACQGAGKILTRAGRAAKKIHDAWIAENLTVEAQTLRVGDRFRPSSHVNDWKTIESIQVMEGGQVVLATKHMNYVLPLTGEVLRTATPEEHNALVIRLARLKGTVLTARTS